MDASGRTLAEPAFPADDGAAQPGVRELLSDSSLATIRVAKALRSVRLLATVVAVLDEADEHGGDKDSHMAVVSMVNGRGERGLLAFSGTDSLLAWNPEARPVPAFGRDIARSALAEGSAAVIVDVSGPHRAVIAGTDLAVLADSLDLALVTRAIESTLGAVRIHDSRLISDEADVLVEVPSELVDSVVIALAADTELRRLVPGGVGVIAAGSMDR
ncbi:MAG: SseB family protein [bacterium]|nr:SseB family protein [bacterium]